MLCLTLALAVTTALAASANSEERAPSASQAPGALESDETPDDFEDLFEQRFSHVELRSFAAPAAPRPVNPCGLRGRMADGRREKPPRV